MKKREILLFLMILAIPFASASVLDWITWRVTEEVPAPVAVVAVKEQVKCVFLDSNSEQKCYNSDGKFSCVGAGSCIIEVSGEKGAKLLWKSTCGGYGETIIDENNEELQFNCPIPVAATIETPAEIIKEKVTCVFSASSTEQKCYTDDGKFSCLGINSCAVEVSGQNEQQLYWKSSCGSEAYTKMDSIDESVGFKCEPVAIPQPTSTETVEAPTGYIYEEVTCDFAYSNAIQQCYSEDRKFSCSGKDRCLAKIYGKKGERIIFKGTCKEGYNEILIDGVYQNVWFNCQQTAEVQQQAIPKPIESTPVQEPIKEQVKCIFADSNCQQECHSGDSRFSCSGIGSCSVDISGQKGAQITWGASCGGYAYTLMDGNNENAEFNCGTGSASTCRIDKVKLHYFYWDECPLCESEKLFLEQLKSKYPQVEYDSYSIGNAPGQAYTQFVLSNLKQGLPTIFLDDKIWTGYNDNIASEIENKIKSCLERGCSLTPAIPSSAPSMGTIAPKIATQTQIATQAEPISRENVVNEQIECIFLESDVLKNPHTARPESCNTDDGRFGCKWTGEVIEKNINGNIFRYAYCIAGVSGEKGAKLLWKSTCGGYANTVIDGNNEAVQFKCVPSSEVREEQIIGKGFKYAYWQCYDKTESKGVSIICESSEVWQERAKEACKDKCYEDGSKCGVNSFSVSEECYPEPGRETVIPSIFAATEEVKEEKEVKKETEQKKEKESEKKEEILICKDSCPSDGKCYPFGYRKLGQFCSDQGMFKEQSKENVLCDNNFECTTNICIDGKCMSSGLIQKIMNLFKKLFS